MIYKLSTFGAPADARQVKDAAIDAGLRRLTSLQAAFTAADVGKVIVVSGAGVGGLKHTSTIASVVSTTQAELADPASTSVAGKGATFGTNCGPALQTALGQIENDLGGSLHIDGAYLLTTPVTHQFLEATRAEFLGFGACDRLYIAVAPHTTAITIQSARSLVIDGLNVVGTPNEGEDAWRAFRFEDCELFFRNCGFFGLASIPHWGGSIISTSHCHVSVHDTYFGGCTGSNGLDNPTFDVQGWKSCDFQRTHFIDYGSIGGFEHSKTGSGFSYAWVLVGDPHEQKKGAGHQGALRFLDCLFDEGCLWGIRIQPSTPGLRVRSAVIDGAQMNNSLIADYSAIYAAAVDRLVIANSAIGWAPQPHDGIRLLDCGDVEIDGVQLGDGVNGIRADNVGRITMRGNSGFASFKLANVGFSPVVAKLDFAIGQYSVGSTSYAQLQALPGYSYSRSGAKGEVNPANGVVMFPGNTPAIIAGVGYFSRSEITNRFFSSRDLLSDMATVSVFAKMAELRWLILFCSNGANAAAWFDLQNGVTGSIGGAAAVKQSYIYNCGGGWYQCVLVCSASSAPNAGMALAETDGSFALTNPNGTKGWHGWEAGCYNAALPLPPVITTGGQTRPTVGQDTMRFALPNGRYLAAYTFDDGSTQSVPVSIFNGVFEVATNPGVLNRSVVRSVTVVEN
jgi:hypothetical protein